MQAYSILHSFRLFPQVLAHTLSVSFPARRHERYASSRGAIRAAEAMSRTARHLASMSRPRIETSNDGRLVTPHHATAAHDAEESRDTPAGSYVRARRRCSGMLVSIEVDARCCGAPHRQSLSCSREHAVAGDRSRLGKLIAADSAGCRVIIASVSASIFAARRPPERAVRLGAMRHACYRQLSIFDAPAGHVAAMQRKRFTIQPRRRRDHYQPRYQQGWRQHACCARRATLEVGRIFRAKISGFDGADAADAIALLYCLFRRRLHRSPTASNIIYASVRLPFYDNARCF